MKKSIKAMTILTAAGLLMTSAPLLTTHAAAKANTSAAAASTLKKIDPKLISEAQKKLKDATGKSYSFSKVESWKTGNDSGWTLTIKGARYSYVSITNNKIDSIQLEQKWADLQSSSKETIQSVLRDLEVASLPESATLTINYSGKQADSGKVGVFAHVDNHYITLLDGKVKRVMSTIPVESVSQDIRDAASDAIKGFQGISLGKLTKASYGTENGKSHLELTFQGTSPNMPIFINIDEASQGVTMFEVSSLQDSAAEYTKGYKNLMNMSEDKLLQAAIPLAKSSMNLDLTGYKAAKDKDHPGTVHFTMKNKQSVEGIYNSKGQIYSLKLK
ncbi:hypothetical protein BBD41_11030 [Paenibacillus ihbetae]|uniref:Peptidase n=1 Tax=Paenibacillus ihbetae TaxID=1870820 RepID=A0A1B2DZB9_9BACL|nr:hypothetical protein [Paenibacillus ihbetae]ANY73080.1 hypothetical protein BBD41_11030 [Paenibacillus ihbetae]